jgi:hypothetical protein
MLVVLLIAAKCEYVLHLDLIQLNLARRNNSSQQTEVMVLYMRAKIISSYKLEILEAKICRVDCMVKIRSPGFPHNFVKNNRRDLKMGYIDASRRQLQSVLKIRV